MNSSAIANKSTNGRFYREAPWSLRLALASSAFLAPEFAARAAARLFCTPFGTRGAESPGILEGEETLSVRVGERDIATYCWGEPEHEPLALFAHGWSGSGSQFAAFMRAFREAGYAVVAFDQPAHGKSTGRTTTLLEFAEVLQAVAQYFRGERPLEALVAHSLGATAGAFALSRGLAVQRVILIAPVADAVYASRRFAQALWLPESLRARMQTLLEDRTDVAFGAYRARRVVRALGAHALVIHDALDREVPWQDGEEYAHYWPDARLLTTQGLGHTRILSDPAIIAAAVGFAEGGTVGTRVVGTYNLAPMF